MLLLLFPNQKPASITLLKGQWMQVDENNSEGKCYSDSVCSD